MADSLGDLQHLVSLSANHLSKLGLCFNAKKSAVLVFAGTDTTAAVSLPEGGQIPWKEEYRYLGVQLSTSRHVLDIHEENIRQTSRKAANVMRKRSLWGCNRFLLVREMWKCVHVPCFSFANAVLTFQPGTRQWLERGQREVGRLALGCHGRVAIEAIQGDVGWSSYEAREARSKIAYEGRLRLMNDNRWARRLFRYTSLTGIRTQWTARVYTLRRKFGFFAKPVKASTECGWARAVQEQVREEENEQWRKAMRSKATLTVYRSCKNEIEKERMYDNSGGSGLLFEARAGALRTLVYRRRFDENIDDTSAMCRVCGQEEETIPHLVLRCTCLGPRQREGTTLPEALGFVYTDDTGPPAGDGAAGAVNYAAVRTTKTRLVQWWRATQR